jgi:hypothetical protein
MTTAGMLDFPGVAFLSGTVAFSDTHDGSIGVLPRGALVYEAMLVVTEEFNAGTSNSIWLGTAANPSMFIGMDNGSSIPTHFCRGIEKAGLGVEAPEGGLRVFARYSQAGEPATTGRARVFLLYLPSMR